MVAFPPAACPPPLLEVRRIYEYLSLKDTARAVDALERATDNGEIWSSLFRVSDPMIDPVRDSPRFRAVVRRVGWSDALGPPAR